MIGGAAVHGLRCGVVIGDATEALMQSAVLRPPNHLSPVNDNLVATTQISWCALPLVKRFMYYM
jgi:hypothetical protein